MLLPVLIQDQSPSVHTVIFTKIYKEKAFPGSAGWLSSFLKALPLSLFLWCPCSAGFEPAPHGWATHPSLLRVVQCKTWHPHANKHRLLHHLVNCITHKALWHVLAGVASANSVRFRVVPWGSQSPKVERWVLEWGTRICQDSKVPQSRLLFCLWTKWDEMKWVLHLHLFI